MSRLSLGLTVLALTLLVGCAGNGSDTTQKEQETAAASQPEAAPESKQDVPDERDLVGVRDAYLRIADCAEDGTEYLDRDVDALIEEYREAGEAEFRLWPDSTVSDVTMRQVLQTSRDQLQACAEADDTRAASLVQRINSVLDAAADATTSVENHTEAASDTTRTETSPRATAPSQPIPAKAAVSTTSRCDYLLGDQTETKDGFRFVADATITNTGNVAAYGIAMAQWEQIGRAPVTQKEPIGVGVKREKKVRFDRPATAPEIERHQPTDGDCTVTFKLATTEADASVVNARIKLIDLGAWINRWLRANGCGGFESDACIAGVIPPLTKKVAAAAEGLHPEGQEFLIKAILEETAIEARTRPTIRDEFRTMQSTLNALLGAARR